MRITRVSLVDRPAGIGAEVVLSKRDELGYEDSISDETVKKGDGIAVTDTKNNNKFGERDNMSQAHAARHGRTNMSTDGVNKGMKSMHKESDMADPMEESMEDETDLPRMKRKKMMKSEDDLDTILKSAPEELVSYIERLEDIILDMQEAGIAKADEDDEDDDEDEVEESDDDDEESDDEDDDDDEEVEAEVEVEDDEDDDEDDEPVTKFYDDDDDDLDMILKGADTRLVRIVKSMVAEAEKKAGRAEKLAKRERDLRLHREYVAKAADLTALPAKQGDLVTLLSVVADKAPEVEDLLSSVLKAAHGALKESVLFKTEGSDALDDNTAIAKFDAVIKEIRKNDNSMSAEQAFAKALDSHPELYDEYLNNNKGR
jgi:hypothetical protein